MVSRDNKKSPGISEAEGPDRQSGIKGTLNLPDWEVKDIQVGDCRRPITFVYWVNVGLVK